MTEEDFLTLLLPERIAWLHSEAGPRGFLSHDSFGKLSGATRQAIIQWEKIGGAEPNRATRARLADFSGFPAEAFSRRGAEALLPTTFGHRLRAVEGLLERVVQALVDAGIAIPESEREPLSGQGGQSESTP